MLCWHPFSRYKLQRRIRQSFSIYHCRVCWALEVSSAYLSSKLHDASSSVVSVTPEDIRTHGSRPLADVMRNMRSLHILSETAAGGFVLANAAFTRRDLLPGLADMSGICNVLGKGFRGLFRIMLDYRF